MLCGLTLLKTVQLSGLVQEGSSHAQEAGNEQPDEFVVCSDHTDFVIILKRIHLLLLACLGSLSFIMSPSKLPKKSWFVVRSCA